jgi:hypothetical protein
MKIITVVTRHPDVVKDYLGFGCREVERGVSKFNDQVLIVEAPDEHTMWQSMRLSSGMHASRIMETDAESETWKADWGYEPSV